jgi:integrase
MAFLQFDEASGRYRLRFNFGGRKFKRSIKTKDQKIALGIQARVEETIRLLEQGRLELPANADPAAFILSDGKKAGKTVLQKALTLGELIDCYQRSLPVGTKEVNTITTEKLHCKHLLRILGKQVPAQSLATAEMQRYSDQRSQEKGRRGKVRPQTIKKELDTLRVIWNWAVSFGHLAGTAPVKGIKFAKAREQLPFQTWEEIQRTIDRGGLTAEEQRELWDCLFLTIPQIAELLEVVKVKSRQPFLYPMFVFAAHTGARRSEMMRSRVEDFDFDGRTVLIREKKRDKTKLLTFRRVPMSPLLAEVFSEWFARHPGGAYVLCREANQVLRQTCTTKSFRRSLKGTKWVRMRGFHAFRHSFASNLAAAGVDQRIIDEFMGHQTEAMRRRYRHLFPEQRRMAIEAVFARQPQHEATGVALAG